jgi:hypothetical protein
MSNLAGTFKSTFKTVDYDTVSGVTPTQVKFETILTGAAQSAYLLQCDIACTGETGIQVSVKISRGVNFAYLVKKAPIPQGSTLQIIDGQKLVLQAGDILEVACETEGQSADVIISHVDHVNLD